MCRVDLNARGLQNGTLLVWLVVLPVLQLGLYAAVFAGIFKARVPGLDAMGYVGFLSLGLWPWFAFSEAVSRGATALVDNAGLLGKTAISPFQLILARVASAFMIHGLGFLIVLVVLFALQIPLKPTGLPWVMAGWLVLLACAAAFAVIAALVCVFVRDVQHLLPLALTAVFFLSPLLYRLESLPEWSHPAQWFNPAGLSIVALRDGLLWEPSPTHLLVALIGAAAVAGLARALYARLRVPMTDYL
nr:ABC transporter permease [Lysobacter sp. CAU 1642]